MATVIDKVLKTAQKQKAGAPWLSGSVTYYKISSRAAGRVMRETFGHSRVPRPGYEVRLPESEHNGHKGYWTLSNHGERGRYELMFHY